MTSSKQQTIRARIAREAIAKVMQFFDGTLAQALQEILQNARRSGATSVAITRDQANTRITVSDDGRGIGDPTALLAFGRSGWPKDLHGAEHPAGMGIFSLARRSPGYARGSPGAPPGASSSGRTTSSDARPRPSRRTPAGTATTAPK